MKPTVLLFYDGYERKARERTSTRIYYAAHSRLRSFVRRAKGKQVNTGFYEAFLSLVKSLEDFGHPVRVNDFASARKNPCYPIGLAGYPDVLKNVNLPNPLILGPGDPGSPQEAAELIRQRDVRKIIQPSDWVVALYEPYCPGRMLRCPVAIDLDAIPYRRDGNKALDMLIYDKMHFDRDRWKPAVLDPLIEALERRGKTWKCIAYGSHTREHYLQLLGASRSLAFLSAHETQGLACGEAMAMNVPVFAWDEGKLVDPVQLAFVSDDFRVSSTPYFDPRCGVRFTADALELKLNEFFEKVAEYRPRDYLAEHLQPAATAKLYSDAYVAEIPNGTDACFS